MGYRLKEIKVLTKTFEKNSVTVFFLDGGFLTCDNYAKVSLTPFAFAKIIPVTGETAVRICKGSPA